MGDLRHYTMQSQGSESGVALRARESGVNNPRTVDDMA